jgi:hypothetical protein
MRRIIVAPCQVSSDVGIDPSPPQLLFMPAATGHARKSVRHRGRRADPRPRGEGIVLVDGRLVEKLHIDYAHRLLTLAAAIERNDGGRRIGRCFR